MECSRQEYWSRLPFPSPGDLPYPGIEPESPELQADSLGSEPPGKLKPGGSAAAQVAAGAQPHPPPCPKTFEPHQLKRRLSATVGSPRTT